MGHVRIRNGLSRILCIAPAWALLAALTPVVGAEPDQEPAGFGAPILVDPDLAGGEPLVIYSHRFHTLVYASHEGGSHLYRNGLEQNPGPVICPDPSTATCFDNRINLWYSSDGGAHWTRSRGLERMAYTGFSDPDLTEDAAGNLYATGIGPFVPASLFASADGGRTWPTGTPECHDGDRPWVAAAGDHQVFFAITPLEDVLERRVFLSTDGGVTCSTAGSTDHGSTSSGAVYTGQGKLLFDAHDGSLIGPQGYFDSLTLQNRNGVGISRLADAVSAVPAGTSFTNIYHLDTTVQPFFQPRLAMDAGENLYLTWATNDRVPGSTGGCNGAETPKPSSIKLVIGRHQGPGRWQWSAPLDISPASAGQDMWPWVAAGDAGRVSVVWYHRDKLDDIDCGQLNGVDVNSDTFIYEAHIIGAEDPTTRTITVTNASRRSIHRGQICMSGTQCVATGKDRRLGDFLTNAVDGEGCVLIASGDTEVPQAQGQALSRPIFIRQTSGPSLTGKQCGAPSSERMLTAAHASSRLPDTSPDAPAFWLMILPTAALALRRRPGHSRLP